MSEPEEAIRLIQSYAEACAFATYLPVRASRIQACNRIALKLFEALAGRKPTQEEEEKLGF
ncbi:MAG TPA: hypothetical protein PKY77_05660 [Phycisphaerae bacterium]|nr:hypothetical protein [Phycisphaerae bacterium]HRY69070.1 hypothetical protein [Phycisphaerae bacterium]HSA25955.1 hypothetical protein [Phycisphaerae bacterium]